jgi:hypothetical protein
MNAQFKLCAQLASLSVGHGSAFPNTPVHSRAVQPNTQILSDSLLQPNHSRHNLPIRGRTKANRYFLARSKDRFLFPIPPQTRISDQPKTGAPGAPKEPGHVRPQHRAGVVEGKERTKAAFFQ